MEKEVKAKFHGSGNTTISKQKDEILLTAKDKDSKNDFHLIGYIFDSKGKLKNIIKHNAIWYIGGIIGNDFNVYKIQAENNGIKIIKYEREPIKK